MRYFSTAIRARTVNPSALNLRVGRILECRRHDNAEKLYVSQVDVGDETIQVCSGLVPYLSLEEMKLSRVVVVANLKPSKMRGEVSQAMLLAAEREDTVRLVKPVDQIPVGKQLVFGAYDGEYPARLKSKVWEEIQKGLKTNEKGEVVYIDDKGEHPLTPPCTSLPNAIVR